LLCVGMYTPIHVCGVKVDYRIQSSDFPKFGNISISRYQTI
jgi:hypothetical protein